MKVKQKIPSRRNKNIEVDEITAKLTDRAAVSSAIIKWIHGDKEPLGKLLPELKSMYESKSRTDDDDRRTGEEVYGYVESEIRDTMCYISDRWNCAMRIRWLIDGIENGALK